MNRFTATPDNEPRVDRLFDPATTIVTSFAMVSVPLIHRIDSLCNIGISARIPRTVTTTTASRNVPIREKIDSSRPGVDFCSSAIQDASLVNPGLEVREPSQWPDMPDIFGLITIVTALVAVWFAVQIRSMLTRWTARQAWTWMIVSLLAVLLHSVLSLPALQMNGAVNSAAAYFSATMLLTPLVTILGARRPGIFAWHWFVVLPMIVVLQWAAFSQLQGNHWRTPIELSVPLIMGFAVVLIMSTGTFLGTNSLFALVYALGTAILLTSSATPASVQSPVLRSGPLLILAAVWIFHRNLRMQTAQLRTASTAVLQTKALQDLFGTLYGFAWSRRVLDRVNQFAPREQWSVRLTSAGFERPDGNIPMDEELRKPCEALIWVLARFGDETWLNRILNPPTIICPEDPNNRHNPIVPSN